MADDRYGYDKGEAKAYGSNDSDKDVDVEGDQAYAQYADDNIVVLYTHLSHVVALVIRSCLQLYHSWISNSVITFFTFYSSVVE
jgi:hypothetical protein